MPIHTNAYQEFKNKTIAPAKFIDFKFTEISSKEKL